MPPIRGIIYMRLYHRLLKAALHKKTCFVNCSLRNLEVILLRNGTSTFFIVTNKSPNKQKDLTFRQTHKTTQFFNFFFFFFFLRKNTSMLYHIKLNWIPFLLFTNSKGIHTLNYKIL